MVSSPRNRSRTRTLMSQYMGHGCITFCIRERCSFKKDFKNASCRLIHLVMSVKLNGFKHLLISASAYYEQHGDPGGKPYDFTRWDGQPITFARCVVELE